MPRPTVTTPGAISAVLAGGCGNGTPHHLAGKKARNIANVAGEPVLRANALRLA